MKTFIALFTVLLSINMYAFKYQRLGIDYSACEADANEKLKREEHKASKKPINYTCYELNLDYKRTENNFKVKTFPNESDGQRPALYGDELTANNGIPLLDFINIYASKTSHNYTLENEDKYFGEIYGLYYGSIPWKTEPSQNLLDLDAVTFAININFYEGKIPNYTKQMNRGIRYFNSAKAGVGYPESLLTEMINFEQMDNKVSHIMVYDSSGNPIPELFVRLQCLKDLK